MTRATTLACIFKIARCKLRIAETIGFALALLITRLYVGKFFWQSGRTKYANIDSAKDLFRTEYIPNWEKNRVQNIFGIDVSFPVPSIDFATISSTYGELLFAAMLIAGLGARIGAFGIFMMTLAIEAFVYPGTIEHKYWLLTMFIVMTAGPGKISFDYFIRKKLLEQGDAAKP